MLLSSPVTQKTANKWKRLESGQWLDVSDGWSSLPCYKEFYRHYSYLSMWCSFVDPLLPPLSTIGKWVKVGAVLGNGTFTKKVPPPPSPSPSPIHTRTQC
jgi:hypothetical protein